MGLPAAARGVPSLSGCPSQPETLPQSHHFVRLQGARRKALHRCGHRDRSLVGPMAPLRHTIPVVRSLCGARALVDQLQEQKGRIDQGKFRSPEPCRRFPGWRCLCYRRLIFPYTKHQAFDLCVRVALIKAQCRDQARAAVPAERQTHADANPCPVPLPEKSHPE